MKLDYIGKELENFSVARLWRNYVMSHFKKYYKNKNVLEVGSGVGSFSELAIKDVNELTILEPDQNFCNFLRSKFKNQKKLMELPMI
jgi:16S rRNA A1518/A1519 N6-dimethyltransferase RsmA/KsgA/DIM1 with predicted DNA glycosylase/AP lyase activity